jgi:hypothetical protein
MQLVSLMWRTPRIERPDHLFVHNGERRTHAALPVLERVVLERANTWTVCAATVAVVGHSVLRLTLTGGLVAEVDVLERMRGPAFAQARTPGGLRPVAIDPETGTAVWPCRVPRPRLVSVEVDDESAWPGRSYSQTTTARSGT